MNEQELKKEQFIAKAMENKEKFAIHKRLIEENLCIGGKMYVEDLKVFAERQVVDNQLLLNLMQYSEDFSKEYLKLKSQKLIDYIHEFSFEFGKLWNTELSHEEKMLRISEKLKLPEEVVSEIFKAE